MLEKREFVRIPVGFKVKYTENAGVSPKSGEAISVNISQNGILIFTHEPLSVSMEMDLEITALRLPTPIKTSGRIVRIEEVEEGKGYNIGIKFLNILERDSLFIKQYIQSVDLHHLLHLAVSKNASDLHLLADQCPVIRVHGELMPLSTKSLTGEEIKGVIYGFLSEQQKEEFEKELELDISFATDMGRFRVNIHKEKGQYGAAFRYIPAEIKSIEELRLPLVIKELALKPNGLILVTGPTGSGKSTTLAAMIDFINKEKNAMIIGLEDPIEYVHKPQKSTIRQREIGTDTASFINALKHTLRQDVDVILVGEIRDLDSIAVAMTAAETGHLVLTTLHTTDTISTLNRIVDVFPANQQQQIKVQLSECLRGIIAQVLVPRKDKNGRVVATEVLVCTNAVANIIRQGNYSQLWNVMYSGIQHGMHSMDQSLEDLYKQGIISRESLLAHLKNSPDFVKKVQDTPPR